MKKLIDVYPYRIRNSNIEFLLLLRSSDKIYAGQWRMIGGKVHENEKYWEAGLRELNEETGLKPVKFWVIPSVNTFYEADSDTIHHIPAFAAELNSDSKIILNNEHSEAKWIDVRDIESHIMWPEQQRLLKLLHHIVTEEEKRLLTEWEVEI